MHHGLKYIFGIALALAIGVGWYYAQVFNCQRIESNLAFRAATPKCYFSKQISGVSQQNTRAAIGAARQRIAAFWGKQLGDATIIVCNTPAQYRDFCHSNEGAGCSIGTPWGDSFIVLNPYGLDTDVIAHEMCHDELYTRLGWWKLAYQIPQWFNEGLALMVDYRFVTTQDSIQRYIDYKTEWTYRSYGQQKKLELADISRASGFFGGDPAHVMLAYMTAGMEVAEWLSLNPKRAVVVLVNELKAGKKFEDVYKKKRTLPAAH